MSIRIDREICIGCGACAEVCPGTLIHITDGKAEIRYPKDCWGCTSCLKECPVYAIRFYLAADLGGQGTELHTEPDGDILRWIFTHPDGSTEEIRIDRRESNKY